MPGIIEGEWNVVSVIMIAITCIFLLLFFGLMVFPYLAHIECEFPCGCRIDDKPYDAYHGNLVKHLYSENGELYAELCNGETMRVDHFEGSVPV